MKKVAVLGASPNPERYSNKAIKQLSKAGYEVVPINPGHKVIEGINSVRSLEELEAGSIDTVTMYVGPDRSVNLGSALKNLQPRRVIFNPGSENSALQKELEEKEIEVVEACTLVMLATGQF